MDRSDLILIGYWAGPGAGDWPGPQCFVDHDWDEEEREQVADYLLRGLVSRAYMGYSPCRICGCDNGALELSDGTYVWPEGLRHYVVEHGVRLPSGFVLARAGNLRAGRDCRAGRRMVA
ncbi:MAG: hypothetical protein J0H73_16400 [Salana multivorans]|uniref:hypothetical protein n=1 Tax=Salana multivorans TaxID=120377 RepID=UPI000A5C215D|nr:hypothetical protein [Salana multivorans]MBN8883879.1 hypothetical protein [Salana multivorans]